MPVFDTPGSVSLQIKLPSGRVVVTTADEPRTSVELVPIGRRGPDAMDDIEISADERTGGHVMRIEQKDRFRWGPIQITWGGDFEVPHHLPAREPTSSSPAARRTFASRGTSARCRCVRRPATSGSGAVGSKLQVKTASGDVSVGAIEARGVAATVSGDVGGRAHRAARSRRVPSPATSRSARSQRR